jgi:CspA family cold shock protein
MGDDVRTIGKIKCFDPIKGFYLVVTDEGTTAALDIQTLAAAGLDTIPDGTTVGIDIALGRSGLTVTRVHSVSGEPPRPDDTAGDIGGQAPLGRRVKAKARLGGVVTGICKWYSRGKGYGFITPVRGGEDVFVQMDVLINARIRELRPGQRVVFEMARGVKGPTVTRIITVINP